MSRKICPFKGVLLVLCLAGSSAPVFAQATTGTCSAQPPAADGTTQPVNPSLTERLDSCNGVLTPPAIGDGEIMEPAPQAGDTPVITPNQLPQGENPSNNPG